MIPQQEVVHFRFEVSTAWPDFWLGHSGQDGCPSLLVTPEASSRFPFSSFTLNLGFCFFSFVFEYGFSTPVSILDVFVFLSSSLDNLMSFLMVIPVKVLPPKILPLEKGC